MELKMVEQTPEEKVLTKLRILEDKIQSADRMTVRLRWQSGREMTKVREAHPELTVEAIAEKLGIDQAELSYRMRFAEMPEEGLMSLEHKTWKEVKTDLPQLVGRKRAASKPKASKLNKTSTKQAVVVKEFKTFIRRVKTELGKVHAKDLAESDWKVLDTIQEEIARIYDEIEL